jgi:DNA-binding NtrC family response regulator
MMHAHKLTIDEPVLLGDGSVMDWLRSAASRVAGGNAKVLITGESGVGKDLVARFIHARSPRATRAFVALNCAGISETLLESELFGHVRGSFTGAHRDKVGMFQLADKGTVFLDEVGEMSLRMQALLLRFLENGEVKPVGSDSVSAKVDVRVIAATNRNLPDLVSRGLFREDLMYRIMVVHLEVPPLRNRREDIRTLVTHIIKRSSLSVDISDEAIKALEHVAASEPSDINANVAGYAKAYAALEKQSKVVKSRAEEMRSKGDEFFKEWEAPKNVSPERRAQLTASYGQIKQEMTAAKEGFIPFLASLRDIQSYLKVDATPTGIHSMGALVAKAKENATHVKASIDAVLTQVNSVHGMIST